MRSWASLLTVILAAHAAAIEIVAHRGAKDETPENTFAAAKRCIELGVDYLDTDVNMSKDGVFYVIHDLSVARTTNGTGLLLSLTSAEIDQLDAGIKFSEKFKGERVPRLEDYIALVKDKAGIYIDFKTGDLPKLLELLRRAGIDKKCFFWFMNPTMALKFRELAPDWPLKVNASTPEAIEEAVTKYKCTMIETNVDKVTPEFRAALAKHGLKLMLKATRDDEAEYREIIAANPDFANVDYPGKFKALLVEKR